jgi:hypothetical protein
MALNERWVLSQVEYETSMGTRAKAARVLATLILFLRKSTTTVLIQNGHQVSFLNAGDHD